MLSRYSQQHARARPSSARGTCAVVRYRQNRSSNQEGLAASAATRPESSAGNPLTAAAHSYRKQPEDADVCASGSSTGTRTAQQQQQQQGRRGVPPDRAGSTTQAHGHPTKPQGGDHLSSSDFWVVVQHLEQQAAEEPTITAALLDTDVAVLADPPPAAAAAAAQRPTRLHLGRRHVQALDFDRMYRQLAEFKRTHLTAHVPRHCWDAPELGAWVRQLRKDRKERRLERWKVDRLNLLGFQWRLTEQDAKWHYAYHQLRRYKAVHGTTAISAGYSDRQEKDWGMLARWLEVQGCAVAQRKLPLQHQHMLARLGVTLTVPRALVHRYARLQVTNAHERKLLRRAWRQHDQDKAAAHAAAADAARAAALKQLQEEEQGLLLRQQLLQDSVQVQSTIPEHLQQELQRLQEVLQDLQQRQQQLQGKPVRRQSLWWQFRRLNPKLRRRFMLRLTSSSRRRMAPGAAAAAGSQQPLKPQLRQQQQQASKPGPVSYTPGIQASSRWQWTGSPQGALRGGRVSRQETAAGVASAAAGAPIPVATAATRTARGGQQKQQRMPAGQHTTPRLQATAAASGHGEVRQRRRQQQPRTQPAQQHQQRQGHRQQQQQQQVLPQVQSSDQLPMDLATDYLEQASGSFAGPKVHGAEQQGINEGHLGQQQLPLEEVRVAESAESWSSSTTTSSSSSSSSSSTGSAADTEAQPVSSGEPSSSDTGGEAPAPTATPMGALYERWRSSARRRHSRQEMAQRVLEQQQVGAE